MAGRPSEGAFATRPWHVSISRSLDCWRPRPSRDFREPSNARGGSAMEPDDDPDVPLSHIDEVANRFEAACEAAAAAGGRPPRIEDYVRGVDGTARVPLLAVLIALDRGYRAQW